MKFYWQKLAIQTGMRFAKNRGDHLDQIDRFIVAGAFGTYLDINSAKQIGMFPDIPTERFEQ
jgi:uncharacterized 2Fe-2S/4Fe-4S cluster protein (DUF4445 family)